MQENIISDGQTVLAEDTNPNATEMTRRFKGSLQLSRAPATSFRSYNIEVSVSKSSTEGGCQPKLLSKLILESTVSHRLPIDVWILPYGWRNSSTHRPR